MICQYCGTENRPEVNFCRNCGQRLLPTAVLPAQPAGKDALESSGTAVFPAAQATVEEHPACPHCGMTVKPGARFCAHCGNALSPMQVSSFPPPVQSPLLPVEQPAPLQPNMPAQPVYTPSPPQAGPAQSIIGEYPPTYSGAEASRPLKSPGPPRARGRQLPAWIVWLVVGVAIVAVITIIVLLITAGPKLLSALRATATPLPTVTLQPTALPQPTPTTTAVLPDAAQVAFPLHIQLTTAPEPWRVGQHGVVTLTLRNDSSATIHLQRLELLGHLEPTLVFTPTAQKDITSTLALAPATSWTETFTFNAQQAGEGLVRASVKFERSDTQRVEILDSEELQIHVADHSQ